MNPNKRASWLPKRGATWQYWGLRLWPAVELTPLRIAVIYAFFGVIALFTSDVLFVQYFSEPVLSQVQALKGGVEVVLTAGFIWVLTTQRESQVQQSLTQLDQAREELQVLHRVLRHNLRNDLTVIMGRVNLIRQQAVSDALDTDCAKILTTVEKMEQYTEQATKIRKISENGRQRRTFDLTETIPRLVTDHPDVPEAAAVSVSIPGQAKVEANPMLPDALDELLTNAIRHNDTETPWVSIDVQADGEPAHMVEIHVTDNGPGISDAELAPLETGRENQLLHLSGMGLWFVKWTVRHSSGTLSFTESEDEGTIAIIRIPKAPAMLSSSLPIR